MVKRPPKLDYYETVELRITNAVASVISDPTNEENLFELLLCGYIAYKGGLGLPHSSVHAAIKKGIENGKL